MKCIFYTELIHAGLRIFYRHLQLPIADGVWTAGYEGARLRSLVTLRPIRKNTCGR